MRSLLETEEDEESKAAEITLSTASLLGIFFGLVLICGVFFGFGYSMGRGNGPGAQAASLGTGPGSSAAEPDETATAGNPQPAALAPAEQQEDVQAPARAALTPSVTRQKPDDAAASKTPVDDASGEEAPPVPKRSEIAAEPVRTPSAKPPAAKSTVEVAATAAPAVGTASGSGQPMVQIAAVARREDADVLVSALRQRGYGVVVRNEPQDKLLHVQVGPFADRGQATAIKQKLLSDGYNAIIKQ
jgi:DedD protein